MIAAMANYLKFDVYNLDLTTFFSDSELLEALRCTSSRSVIVVEDIDCNKVVHDRSKEAAEVDPKFVKVTRVDQKTINYTKLSHFLWILVCAACFCRSHSRVY